MKEIRLADICIAGRGQIFHNLSVPQLVAQALQRGEGTLTDTGAFNVNTGKYTGRSPEDKFIVDSPAVHDNIDWGEVNHPISKEHFRLIKCKMHAYLQNKPLFIFDGFAGARPGSRLAFRFINEYAYQNLFAHQLLIRPNEEELENFEPDYTVICVPRFSRIPEYDGVHSETAIIIDFESRIVLIAGNLYCGEMKKAVFTVMNYELPKAGILPMHCSANMDVRGSTALFFGLSGTGKTTLSSSADRLLIGDDEHGWDDHGIFNLEGGCYAKCIDLDREKEPEIFGAIKFGAVLENVIASPDGIPDYGDHTLTYNTRAAYPLSHISCVSPDGCGNVPGTIIFLTADASGVLPPISRLSPDKALYYYMSGYTSKISGTERGISHPVATFSAMFGAPFFPLKPEVYIRLLYSKLKESGAKVFLVNTGWCGGTADAVPRLSLKYTRLMVEAAVSGALDNCEYRHDVQFGLDIPFGCPEVPDSMLDPSLLWKNKSEYERQRRWLLDAFAENFQRKYSDVDICTWKINPESRQP